jgi:diadenosine tetraphosphate (Ap4A) HIT family hydrolase
LSADEKTQLMRAVFAVETAMKRVLNPKKLNLASLGNWVPHVHWHIIPRWDDDAHWPNSIWAAKQRDASDRGVAHKAELAQAIVEQLQTP